MTEEVRKEPAAVRSFRVTDEVMAKFNGIKESLKLNQDSALAMLVSTYEMEQAKELIPNRGMEISNFQAKAQELIDAFLFSLQLNQDAETRIRGEFALQMASKDATIINYQQQVEAMASERQALKDQAGMAIELQAQIEAERNQAHARLVADAERIQELRSSLADLREDNAGMKKELAAMDSMKAQNQTAQNRIATLEAELVNLKTKHAIDLEKAYSSSEIAKAQAVADAKVAMQEQIDKLKDQLTAAQIATERAVRDAVRSAEEKAHAADKAAAADLAKAQAEIQMLRNQLAQMMPHKEQ